MIVHYLGLKFWAGGNWGLLNLICINMGKITQGHSNIPNVILWHLDSQRWILDIFLNINIKMRHKVVHCHAIHSSNTVLYADSKWQNKTTLYANSMRA